MELKNSQTCKNLLNSYVAECLASERYDMMAKAAKQIGKYEVYEALSEVRRNECFHAEAFREKLIPAVVDCDVKIDAGLPFRENGDLMHDLKTAADIEYDESLNIYAGFAKTARDEGFPDIADLFELVGAVEHCHMLMLNEIRSQLCDDTMYRRGTPTKWKCSNCGHEQTTEEAPVRCPLCGSDQGYVKLRM
ncbi:MAG: rubrerythrin family protein [Clostridia bacterium]|nr:rubrerythrin family protein [Clostridia bacterium]